VAGLLLAIAGPKDHKDKVRAETFGSGRFFGGEN
jgi:hypothetical protein